MGLCSSRRQDGVKPLKPFGELEDQSIISALEAATLPEFITAVRQLKQWQVYSSLSSLRCDLDQLNLVIEQVQACKKDMVSYRTSFTACAMASLWGLRENLTSGSDITRRILRFLASELDDHFGECPHLVLANLEDDFAALCKHEVGGVSGELWAGYLLVGEHFHMRLDEHKIATLKAGDAEFIAHLEEQLNQLKEKYLGHQVVQWFIEGMRKSVRRGNYGFLNFDSFVVACAGVSGDLAWARLGWIAVKWAERDAIHDKQFGTGREEKHFHEVAVTIMPRFVSQLTTLHSAVEAQIKKAEAVQAKLLALFVSISIAVFQALGRFLSERFERLKND